MVLKRTSGTFDTITLEIRSKDSYDTFTQTVLGTMSVGDINSYTLQLFPTESDDV